MKYSEHLNKQRSDSKSRTLTPLHQRRLSDHQCHQFRSSKTQLQHLKNSKTYKNSSSNFIFSFQKVILARKKIVPGQLEQSLCLYCKSKHHLLISSTFSVTLQLNRGLPSPHQDNGLTGFISVVNPRKIGHTTQQGDIRIWEAINNSVFQIRTLKSVDYKLQAQVFAIVLIITNTCTFG